VSLRELLEGSGRLLCGWCTIPAQLTAEAVQHSGADLLFIDGQHGMMGWDTVLRLVEGITPGRCPVLVRVPSQDPANLMHALDAGADGVIVPFVNTAAEAAAAARACRYPPSGSRSWGPTRRMARGDLDTEAANASIACIAMVETPEALANVAAIAAVPGIDGILLGANDLALTMATAERTAAQVRESEEYRAAYAAVARACREAGIVAAAPGPSAEEALRAGGLGYRMLILPSDAAILRRGIADLVAAIEGAAPAVTAAPTGY
jgi:4-hydroxy-2-oxoheptanedioate aldolase